uniref:Uncharacterized protein n=2 Tax=Cacopsylla melanoneura TaxID=428564 RepID=A0A8D8TAV1_9HEMI
MVFCFLKLFLLSIVSALSCLSEHAGKEGANDISKYKNVIVYGIPEHIGEDIMQTVKHIGHDKLDLNNPLDGVERAYRLNCTKSIRPIVIKLAKAALKDQWLKAYRRRNNLNREGNWFLFDDLPKCIQKLEQKTKKWAKTKKYAKVWTLMSEVFYRKNETSPVMKVTDDEHLQYLHANETHYEVTEHPELLIQVPKSVVVNGFAKAGD